MSFKTCRAQKTSKTLAAISFSHAAYKHDHTKSEKPKHPGPVGSVPSLLSLRFSQDKQANSPALPSPCPLPRTPPAPHRYTFVLLSGRPSRRRPHHRHNSTGQRTLPTRSAQARGTLSTRTRTQHAHAVPPRHLPPPRLARRLSRRASAVLGAPTLRPTARR